MKIKIGLALSALVAIFDVACAAPPGVPTAAPYIVLSDNLDEPNGYGFCVDTRGPGQSDLLHAHTCKPHKEGQPQDYAGFDTRFAYNSSTGHIASYAFGGNCLQVLMARGFSVFALLECSDHPRQKFLYEETDQTFRLSESKELCISVGPETATAGRWVSRPLTLEKCEEVDTELKQWTVVAE